MKIKLPRNCSGNEVVEAFIVSSKSLEKSEEHKWEPEKYDGKIEYEPSAGKIINTGVRLVLHYWSKGGKFLCFSWESGWKRATDEACGPPEIRLLPIRLDNSYEFVDIRIGRMVYGAIGYQDGWHESLGDDEIYDEQVQQLINKFYEILN